MQFSAQGKTQSTCARGGVFKQPPSMCVCQGESQAGTEAHAHHHYLLFCLPHHRTARQHPQNAYSCKSSVATSVASKQSLPLYLPVWHSHESIKCVGNWQTKLWPQRVQQGPGIQLSEAVQTVLRAPTQQGTPNTAGDVCSQLLQHVTTVQHDAQFKRTHQQHVGIWTFHPPALETQHKPKPLTGFVLCLNPVGGGVVRMMLLMPTSRMRVTESLKTAV